MRRLLLLTLLIAPLSGCFWDFYNPPAPQLDSYAYEGDWSGAIKDSVAGEGTLTVSILTYSDYGSMTGTWSADFGDLGTSEGVLRGNNYSPDEINVTLSPASAPNCPLEMTGARTGNTVTGVFTVGATKEACTEAQFGVGSLSITKQE